MKTRVSVDKEKYISQIMTYSPNPRSSIFVFYKDGRTEEIENKKIKKFIEFAESSQIIDKNLASGVKSDFPSIFLPQPSHEHLDSLYQQMQTLVAQELITAENEDKKLLIFAAEEHDNSGSLLLQMILLYILKEAKINNLLIEASPTLLSKLIYHPRMVKELNVEHSVPLADHELKMNVVGADIDVSEDAYASDKQREAFMISKCLETNDNCCFIIGAAHIKNLMSDEGLKSKYRIIGLNIRCITEEQLKFQLSKAKSLEEKESLVFPSLPTKVIQINLVGNVSSLEPTAILASASNIHYKKSGNEDPLLTSLNAKLKKYPKNVANRLARADFYISRNEYSKALADFQYIYDEYPTHQKAFHGIEMCKKHLSQDKKLETQPSSKKQSAFFLPSPITSNTIPPALQIALKDGGIEEYIKNGHAKLEQLIELQNTKPWVIGALRCYNIRQGIYKDHIDIDQLSKLTEEQIHSIEHKFKDAALQAAVEEYLRLTYTPRGVEPMD